MERLYRLFEGRFGRTPSEVVPLTGSASPRSYFRMLSGADSCIGVIGTDRRENRAFAALSEHLLSKGLPVPEVWAVSGDGMSYIQEDLGDAVLFDLYMKSRKTGEGEEQCRRLLIDTVRLLPEMQFAGAAGLDFSVCHPQMEFTCRSAMFDLNYFKYCFLKPVGLEFHEMALQDDMERFAYDLCTCGIPLRGGSASSETLLYRDCQARNVMIHGGRPFFIDFQGARKGPVYYDVASFIYHARAKYDDALRESMLEAYLESLSSYIEVDREVFMKNLRLFRLFRCLQVLGAYGFRGWVEQKANFVVSIPETVQSLAQLVGGSDFDRYPYLMKILRELAGLPRFASREEKSGLTVTVTSFSFRKGIPSDPSGNGGGYVFDCRSIHNPGRYEPYRKLTGRDEPVIRFLEADGEVCGFMEHVYGMVDPHVETFRSRGFSSLMVSFGCTGGQHRSVYCAEHLARHLTEKYSDITVRLVHREQTDAI